MAYWREFPSFFMSEHQALAQTRPGKILRATNVVAYVIVIAVDIAASAGGLPATHAHVIRSYHTPLTPVGWTFILSGILKLAQGGGIVYQVVEWGYSTDKWKTRAVNSIGIFWQLGWYFEVVFHFLFCQETSGYLVASLVVLLGELSSYAIAFSRIYDACLETRGILPMTRFSYVLFFAPTVMMLAWLTMLTAVTGLGVAVSFGVDRGSRDLELVSCVFAVIVTVAGVVIELSFRDIVYSFTLAWAFLGVWLSSHEQKIVTIVVMVCGLLSAAMAISSVVRKIHRHWTGSAALRAMGEAVANRFHTFAHVMRGPGRQMSSRDEVQEGLIDSTP